MAPRKRAAPTPDDADTLRRAIRALGDYTHVSVRATRGHLNIFVDDGDPLGAGQYGLSFHSHTGRWEPMPFVADLTYLAHDVVGALGPTSNDRTFPTRKAGVGPLGT